MNNETLYVIAVVSNPIRFHSRYNLYRQFEKHIKETPNTKLITVEMAFGERPFYITEVDNKDHVQVRGHDEIWHKENLINIGVSYLSQVYPSWKYVAWIDCDVRFTKGGGGETIAEGDDDNWALETINQLQHYEVVQMWKTCIDMGPNFELVQMHQSFMYRYHENNFHPPIADGRGGYYGAGTKIFWHPGYAWAATRKFFDSVGGLIDAGHGAVLGSGDHHMALAMIGQVWRSMPKNIHDNYKKYMNIWQHRCEELIKRDVGYVDNLITHFWHGKKADRKYQERWEIITGNKFNPELDLKKDSYGMYQLTDRNIRLRDEIRRYFRMRREDSIDL